jgi:hypothetical protein
LYSNCVPAHAASQLQADCLPIVCQLFVGFEDGLLGGILWMISGVHMWESQMRTHHFHIEAD